MHLSFPFEYDKSLILVCLLGLLIGCKSDASEPIKSISTQPTTSQTQKPALNQVPEKVGTNPQVKHGNLTITEAPKAQDKLIIKEEEVISGKAVAATKEAPKKQPKKKKAVVARRKPDIKFEQIRYDFGEIVQGDTVDYKFEFTNEGNAPLVINNAKATCGCTQPSYPFVPIEPGEKGFIGVRYVSVGKEGLQKPLITVTTNASKEPIALMLNGNVKVEDKKAKEIKADTSQVAQKDTLK